jgi:cell wall-associated NlpC family hydrolase
VIGPPAPRRPAPGGGLAVLVVVTVLAALAAPHAQALRGVLADSRAAITWPAAPATPATRRPPPRAARAVAFALRQRGKPYRWGAQGPHAFDCSGLTWAAWRAAGVTIPRTATDQLAGLPRVQGRLQPGDLVVYPSRGPSRRHVAIVVGHGRMVEAPRAGVPVHSTPIRGGWLGAVRPGGRPMTAALLDFFGWGGLTATEQAWAVAGGAAGLAAVLVARVLVGGRGRRR